MAKDEEVGVAKLTKEEKLAKKAAKAAKREAGVDADAESPKKKKKSEKEELPVSPAEEEEAEDGFKVHKYVAPPEPEDETLQCRDCGEDFIFTIGEQEFFKMKGFANKKTRCATCTSAKKERFGEGGGKGGKGGGKGKGGKGGGDRACYNCGESGHMSFECSQPRSGGKGKGGGGGGGGVCYAFQKGECNRGDSCRFSHSS